MLFSIYGRSRSPLALIVSGCISSILVLHFLYASEILPGTRPKAIDPATLLARQSTFWRSFYPDLVKFGPNCDALTHPEDTHLNVPYDASDTNRTRPDRLSMSASQVLQLRATHTSLTTQLKSKDYILPYLQKSRGIVTTAGGSHLPVAVLSIRMLRRTGSELPVEVFLASQEEWDPQICDVVFLAMNARCVVLQDIFDAAGDDKSLRIGKDQYKIMSIVFSSFEEVLFMDSDCFPVFDPSEIFDSEPFQSTSLILWPDFWFPSESPFFFEVAQISAPAIYNRSSTESGEIFYSKKKHKNSLLLALYYNYYGPDFYYPLQSQGAPWEGDKETFLWSAIVFDEPLYTVRKGVSALGYTTMKGEWRASATVQYDPRGDLEIQSRLDLSTEQKLQAQQRPLFVHANFPKFDPTTMFLEEAVDASGPTRDTNGTIRRVWHATEAEGIKLFGFDLERRFWEEIRNMTCEYEGSFSAWAGSSDMCANAILHWQTLFEPSDAQYN
jgi:alpha 1,2-mannosyltransferase